MAYHAGGWRSVVNPGIKLWRPPAEVTHFWRPRNGFGDRFCQTKKDYIDQKAGEQYETKVVGKKVTVLLHTDEFIFV